MQWSWIDIAFPWIGGVAALALLFLLFGTRLLRSEPSSSRWHDRVWLSWLAMVAYLLHNVEEYGIDLFGRLHEFPASMCAVMKLPPYPDCPMPPAFFLAVNLPLFWVGAPIAALLSRRHPLVGLSFYSVIFVNALVHIAPLLAGVGYTPGLLTAVVLFLPLSAWVAHACFGPGRLSYKAMALLIADGVILHVILMGSMQLFVSGLIDSTALVWTQVANAVVFLLIPWLGEKWRNGALINGDVTSARPHRSHAGGGAQ
jgi:Protein of unknown function with HXXEE motif